MNTDRSLLRHLLTAALVMFLICGFTVTPIAGAEFTSSIYDAYDVSVAGASDFTAAAEDTDESVDNNPAVAVVEVVSICIDGESVAIASGIFIAIAGFLGIDWDGLAESWDNFVLDVQDAINNLLHTDTWHRVSSGKGQGALRSAYEEFNPSGGGSGDKKDKQDGKWYFEGKVEEGDLKINTNRLTENQAIHKMEQGKDIITLDQDLARNLLKRYERLTEKQANSRKFEGKHDPDNGWLHHLHPSTGPRLHIWSWK